MPVTAAGLAYSYGTRHLTRHVLKDVSFTAEDGEVTIITGPSGSGKTTLLTILGALRSSTIGRVSVHGAELGLLDKKGLIEARQRIGFIFQRHNLLKSLSVYENVESGLHLLPESDPAMDRIRAHAMLESVGLGTRGKDFPDMLSGGEQQRVAVARALVRMPDLIIADEPTAALDAESGLLVVNLIRKLANMLGCTVIMATHDERSFFAADVRLHMEDGRLRKLA